MTVRQFLFFKATRLRCNWHFSAGVFRIKIDEMGAAVKRYEVQDVLIADPRSRLSRAQWTVDGSTARLVNGERYPSPDFRRIQLLVLRTARAGLL